MNFSFELGHNSLNTEEPIQGFWYQFECPTYEWNDSIVVKYKIQRSSSLSWAIIHCSEKKMSNAREKSFSNWVVFQVCLAWTQSDKKQ